MSLDSIYTVTLIQAKVAPYSLPRPDKVAHVLEKEEGIK